MVGADTIVAKCTFERPGDGRRFQLTSGGWFEGAPGWHIDTSEGIARPIDHRVSPAALRRLLRSPTIAEPASRADQPDRAGPAAGGGRDRRGAARSVAGRRRDRSRARPSACARRRAHRGARVPEAAYGESGGRSARRRHLAARDRAAAGRRPEARDLHPLRHRGATAAPFSACSSSACSPTRAVSPSCAKAKRPSSSGRRVSARCPKSGICTCPKSCVGTTVRGKPLWPCTPASRAAWTGSASRSATRAKASASIARSSIRCLREGKKFVRLSRQLLRRDRSRQGPGA